MQLAQILGVCAFLLAAGLVLAPRAVDEVVIGSIAEMASMPEAALSCDQPLFLEELEFVTGLNCS